MSALSLPAPPPGLPALQKFDPNLTSDLYQLASGVYERASTLVKFIDSDRTLARAAGAETLAIELSAILEGGGLQRMIETLQESSSRGKSSEISFDGMERLRRTEKLLAEAADNIGSFIEPKTGPYLGQALGKESDSDALILIPVVLFGVIGIFIFSR